MPKLKQLSGKDLVSIFAILNFEVISQKGSHIKLQRLSNGNKQTITIPNHKEIDRGTLKAIIRQASKYVPEDMLLEYFQSK